MKDNQVGVIIQAVRLAAASLACNFGRKFVRFAAFQEPIIAKNSPKKNNLLGRRGIIGKIPLLMLW
jgi:hypothetical protein